ncbi:NTPase [Pseudomonas sp. FW215-R2]|uniref:KAP family NTPase n=1 Tax=unclassified Pseudomonas TaxID=196821 RepID=UPI000C886DD4|nr:MULTISPECIES: KAP family NTPase [unclassified Pseudomonas]PMW98844.1 NTPase [Pseudomonas sp. FW215-R2]PMX06991.1 NTPase [Pseudomonas sp. FW215-L1]PMX24369.1 NTPase [Pseudomonas sp. FW215-E1]PNA26339.1 NTPase [Pseudomonas sp. FW215-R4]
MEANSHFSRQDRAIDKVEADVLDRGSFINSLVKTLVHTEYGAEGDVAVRRATGYVVGLTGEWGLGKSSVLNLLGEELKRLDGVVVANLNPWLFKGRDELVNAYFNSLRDALGKSQGEKFSELRGQLERYKASIETAGATVASIMDIYLGGAATAFWQKWLVRAFSTFIKPKTLSTNEERKSLESKLANANVPVVVLIDELDRVEDDEVRAVAQLIKAVGDIKGISYIVAYDPERVVQALGKGNSHADRVKSGENYLEKIIQYAIPLRPLLQNDVVRLIEFALKNNGANLPSPNEPYQKDIVQQLVRVIRTPREVKRLIGVFAVLGEILRDEICPFDLLVYSWLVTKAPGIRDVIARYPEAVVDDPSTEELIKRSSFSQDNKNAPATVSNTLGDAASVHADLIKLIFPRFTSQNEVSGGDRISKRRNLIRLLYLGNPPGMLEKREVQRIWEMKNTEELEGLIRDYFDQGSLSNVLDRLGDLLSELDFSEGQAFWLALSKVLVRQHDWITEEESLGSLADDVGAVIWKFCLLGKDSGKRFKNIVQCLESGRDLVIVPWLLRKHLFAHGLTPHFRSSSDESVLGKNDTIDLLERELPRYRDAVVNGLAMRRLPNMEAIYCLVNSQRWTQELRLSLTSQLNTMEAIATFAALTVRPGFGSSRGQMDELVDADAVLTIINELVALDGYPDNIWLETSVKRLRATLKGKETWAVED